MRILFLRKMKKIYAKGAAPSREPATPSAHPLWARLENKGLTSDCNCAMIWCFVSHMKMICSYIDIPDFASLDCRVCALSACTVSVKLQISVFQIFL